MDVKVAVDATEAAQYVLRQLVVLGPRTSDQIAAGEWFTGRSDLLVTGTILALDRAGFVLAERLDDGAGNTRDLWQVWLTPAGSDAILGGGRG